MRLQGADGEMIMQLEAQFGINDANILEPGEMISVPLPIALPPAAVLPSPGRYSFEFLIDGIHQVSVPFIAVLSPQGA